MFLIPMSHYYHRKPDWGRKKIHFGKARNGILEEERTSFEMQSSGEQGLCVSKEETLGSSRVSE